MGEPFGAVAKRHPHRFGGAVIFEDDRPPPVDHRPLDRDRTRRSGVDGDLERCEIVSPARRFGQLQHAREHGRHELGMGDAILLDERKEAFRVEPLHDDDRPAAPDRAADAGQRRRVIERRGREVDLAVAKPPDVQPCGERRQRHGGRLVGQRTQHALGPSSRAGRIEHRRAQRFIGQRGCGTIGGRLAEIAHARPFAGPIDDETELDPGAIGERRERDLALGLRGDEHLRQAVVDDEGELGRGQIRIDAGVVEP